MSQPSSRELERLAGLAAEVYDAVDGDAFTVVKALNANDAFQMSAAPAHTLERSLLLPAIRRSASLVGLGVDAVGSGIEIISDDPGPRTIRRLYRVKRVDRSVRDGQLKAVCSRESSLLRTDPDELWNVERWVFAFRFSDDHTIAELSVAEILGFEDTGSGPLSIRLGSPFPLLPAAPPDGFFSDDESLFGDDAEADENDEGDLAV